MATRRLAGGLIFGLALQLAIAAEPPTTAIIGTPPQPSWGQLTSEQREILAPLSKDWNSLENIRRKKWLGIAARYPGMNTDEQLRMKARMQEWVSLPPASREMVRDSYKDFKQLPPEQKQLVRQKWEAYSSLPADERQKARESGKSSKLLSQGTAPSPEKAAQQGMSQ